MEDSHNEKAQPLFYRMTAMKNSNRYANYCDEEGSTHRTTVGRSHSGLREEDPQILISSTSLLSPATVKDYYERGITLTT